MAAIFSFDEELGLQVTERRITRDEVYIADEAFFTGTAAEVLPIRELDGRLRSDSVRRGSERRRRPCVFAADVHRSVQSSEIPGLEMEGADSEGSSVGEEHQIVLRFEIRSEIGESD